jgi:protein gp37
MAPIKWNREAKQLGLRARVFCASMADVFEARSDLNASRERLWKLIEETPQLDWLLLTKRPERIKVGFNFSPQTGCFGCGFTGSGRRH